MREHEEADEDEDEDEDSDDMHLAKLLIAGKIRRRRRFGKAAILREMAAA